MKVFIFVTLFLVAIQAAPGILTINSELNEEWEIFKTQFKKKYEPLTEVTRRIIWEENLKYIRQHNLEYDLGIHTYYLGLNDFSDMSNEEFRAKFLGNRMNRSESKGFEFMAPENMGPLPSSIDWRKKGYVTPVKQQTSSCGSCYAFSATGALEGQHFRKTKKLVSLSEQQIVDCSKDGTFGCAGGFIDKVFHYVKYYGIESEEDYPYYAKDMQCVYNKSKVVTKISSYAQIIDGDESELAVAVATVGPVSVTIDASLAAFQNYKGGIYNHLECSSTYLDHAVLVVGYGSDNGSNYWIVKNSWGSNWGIGGYILMSKDKNNQCGIASDASYPIV